MDICSFIHKQNEWSLLLASRLALSQAREVNLVFSPLNLHIALSMVAAGSKGRTADQILSFLRAQTGDELNLFYAHIVSLILADGSRLGGPALMYPSGVWVDESAPLRPTYAEIKKGVYGAEAKTVNFRMKATEVKDEVNA